MQVLIADDNKDSVEMLAILVRGWGFDAITTYDGGTALKLLEATESPRLALLDWIMPGKNGIEICQEIRTEPNRPYTYVILMTGRAGRQQMLEGLHSGADDFLLKPVEASELHARLTAGKRILELQEQLLATQRLLREQATRDSLTGLWNRAMIFGILQRELVRCKRESQPLSVIMADIDYFKSINDTHGHHVGDLVLHQTSKRLLTALRPYDSVGRYGGEEFLIVLPGCNLDVSLMLAERLRGNVASARTRDDGIVISTLTVSLGVATWDGRSAGEELVQMADKALYQAKAQGRNCVVPATLVSDLA